MQTDKEQQELISVIIPIYNIKDCLERCVCSVCAQTYNSLDILLVDDGSDDGTEKLVDELAEKDSRIRVFHKENGGSSSARNKGIREARGKWIGFVDSDDYIEPQMYEKLAECMKKCEVPIAQTSRDEIADDGSRLPDVCVPPAKVTVFEPVQFMRELLMHRGDCSFCTKLTEKRLFDKYLFPEGVLNEDFYLLTELLQEIEGVAVIPEQYYHVYYRQGSNTRKKTKEEFSRVYMDIVNNADRIEELVQNKYPMLLKEAVRFALFQRLDYMLHIPIRAMTKDNDFYRLVKKYLLAHIGDTIHNPYLTKKNKIYLLLLTAAPKTVRIIHSKKCGNQF